MRRECQEEVIGQLFQENQVRHREIMGIITNQARDAILSQQIREQIFAFAPASARSYASCRQEQVSSRGFPRVIFGSRSRQHWVPPPSHHPCSALSLLSEIANCHRFAGTRLGHHDMPASLEPCLTPEPLKPAFKGGLNEAIEERELANRH
jgi:hypothetical protein